jgi:hypothetical protein
MYDDELEVGRICQNCGSFFQDDDDCDFSICMMDEKFEPYADEIIDNGNFSCCHELFLRKRFEYSTEACEHFEEIECLDIPEGMDLETYIKLESLKTANVDGVTKYLYNDDINLVKYALSETFHYVYLGNKGAFEGLLEYYLSLGPAEKLEDVHLRMGIIEVLQRYEDDDERIIKAYAKELERTPSNNTTRQLYTLVLKRLRRCNYEIVADLLYKLLERKEYGAKLRKRIIDTIESDYNYNLILSRGTEEKRYRI